MIITPIVLYKIAYVVFLLFTSNRFYVHTLKVVQILIRNASYYSLKFSEPVLFENMKEQQLVRDPASSIARSLFYLFLTVCIILLHSIGVLF